MGENKIYFLKAITQKNERRVMSIMAWKHRYTILAIMFVTFLLCYMDRMVIASAIPFIAEEFGLSPVAMGGVLSAFFVGYSVMQLPGGVLADKFGPKLTMTAAIVWWSAFTAMTGMVGSLTAMLVIRVLFGLGEGLFPPASFKTISAWFPKREVGRAAGVMLASNTIGPALAPLFVAALVISWGWRPVFYSLLVPGLLVAACVWLYVKDSPRESKYMSEQELAEYDGDAGGKAAAAKIGLIELLKMPVIVVCFIAFFFNNMAAWGIMSWLPTYLLKARGFSVAQMGVYASLPFVTASIGYYLGGHLADKYFSGRRQIPVVIGLLLSALFIYLAAVAPTGEWAVVHLMIGNFFKYIATGGILTLPLALLPSAVVGSTMGVINTGGQIAAFISPLLIGEILNVTNSNFTLVFYCIVGSLVIAAGAASFLRQKQ